MKQQKEIDAKHGQLAISFCFCSFLVNAIG
jgi:hypothetical protein